MPGCGSSKCPKCGENAPCVDHSEVDIGVGIQTFDHEYWCPTHGGFVYAPFAAGDLFSKDPPKVFWRDDAEEDRSTQDQAPKEGK